MRKGLLLALAMSVAIAGGAPVYAQYGSNIPSVTVIPDTILGDANGAPLQTADNYYIFSSLNLENYIFDENGIGTVNAGFSVVDEDRNLVINRKSRATAGDIAAWADLAQSLPLRKNVMATSTGLVIRAVTDLYSANGPTVLDFFGGDPSAFGPYMGLGQEGLPVGGVPDQALATLLVEDDDGNTVSKNFLVKIADGSAGALENEPTTTIEQSTFDDPADPWIYVGVVAPVFPLAPIGGKQTTRLTIDSTNRSTTQSQQMFGFWFRDIVLNDPITGTWPDKVQRVRWTVAVSSIASAQQVPTMRSRIAPGGQGIDVGAFGLLNSEYTVGPLTTSPFGDKNAELFTNRQSDIVQYHYGGDFPEQLATTLGLQLSLDMIVIGPVSQDQRAVMNIDRVIIDQIEHAALDPLAGEASTIFEQTAAQLGADTSWLDIRALLPGGKGTFSLSQDAEGLHIRDQVPGSNFNMLGIWTKRNALLMTEGDLVRVLFTIQDADPTLTSGRFALRPRLGTASEEVSSLINVPCRNPFYTPGEAELPPYLTPVNPAPGGTVYEVYAETPQFYPGADVGGVLGDTWHLNFDAIDIGGDPVFGNPPLGGHYILTNLEVQQVLLPF